jgi:hypothetical protein
MIEFLIYFPLSLLPFRAEEREGCQKISDETHHEWGKAKLGPLAKPSLMAGDVGNRVFPGRLIFSELSNRKIDAIACVLLPASCTSISRQRARHRSLS